MSILITILIVIASIIALFLIVALFLKKEYKVERSVEVNKPVNEVFDYVKHIKNQDKFSKWVMTDPNLRRQYRNGTDGNVGFTLAWDSDNKQVGKGEQEIKGIIEGIRVDCEVRFEKPFKGVADAYFLTNKEGEHETKVTWGMKGSNPYPMNIMCLFIPDMLGKDMAESLNLLKSNLEAV